jgi:hypothetical protein
MSVTVYVSGDVSGHDVSAAQKALVNAPRGGTSPDVRLVPSDLELGFDVNLALNAVSTLTTVVAFAYTLISAKRQSGKQPPMRVAAGPTDEAGSSIESMIEEITPSDVQVSVQYASKSDEEHEWTLRLNYPTGENHVVIVRRTAPEEFDVNIKQVLDG